MSRFNVFLHRTGERLALPKATRSLILVEIASDLEELFNHYVQQGLSEEEAAARAEEKVDMSDEALAELVRIHSDARSWTDRIARRVQPLWERLAPRRWSNRRRSQDSRDRASSSASATSSSKLETSGSQRRRSVRRILFVRCCCSRRNADRDRCMT